MSISKSQYIRGLQCHKSLWLYKNRPELRSLPDAGTESLFETGYSVGELAKKLFPNGVEIEFDSGDFGGMIEKTKEYLKTKDVIYEATFRERGVFAMADILVRNGDVWDMYEVKASTGVKEYHLDDVSVQYFALSHALPLGKAFVMHINNSYERNGELDLGALFTCEDVTSIAKERQEQVGKNLREMEKMLKADEPKVEVGMHCDSPFGCDFADVCWKKLPSPSVFDLYRMASYKKYELYKKGIASFEDIPEDFHLSDTQKLQISTYKDEPLHINKPILKEFLHHIEFPINFFDFETFQEAIPRFDKQRPYQQMPFQYSLHVMQENGEMEHYEFLGDENSDPREELIKSMLSDLTKKGSIIAYNQGFEIGRIRDLADTFPKYKKELLSLEERFLDLLVPFRNLGYYHKDFNGSFSIKSVLPAMFPEDKELDYKSLGSIQNGGEAMEGFASLHLLKDKSKKEQIRNDLLKYCHLDTLAMVRIYEKLIQICHEV